MIAIVVVLLVIIVFVFAYSLCRITGEMDEKMGYK